MWKGSATYLLGSVHMLDGSWIDDLSDLSYWDAHGTEQVWERYFDVWSQACHSPCRFDSMAHPDLVMLLGRFPNEGVCERLYERAALAAHDTGVRIEVNTAGVRKPVGMMYPREGLLRAFHKAGVSITVGSDAHDTVRVGEGIEQAYAFAARVGYRSVDVPCVGGGWRSIPL